MEIEGPINVKKVKAGSLAEFIFQVKDFNGTEEGVIVNDGEDIDFTYRIYNKKNDKLIVYESETLMVATGGNVTSFHKSFFIPDDTKEGTYFFEIKAASLDEENLVSEKVSFEVIRFSDLVKNVVIISLAAGFVIVVLALVYEHRKVTKLKVSSKDFEKYL
ncbi:MAG: hypothetical protein V5A64_02400 [Candidatus Thermoplasmatota archaeon]